MVYQFRLTNGNFKQNVSFQEYDSIGDIVNYLESHYSKSTTNRIRLFRGKTFFTDESKKLIDCGFSNNKVIRLTFTDVYNGGEN